MFFIRTFYETFLVVEEEEGCASLYAHHAVRMDPLCLLVKLKVVLVCLFTFYFIFLCFLLILNYRQYFIPLFTFVYP